MRRAYFSYYETFETIIAKFKTPEEREAFRKKLITYGLYGTEPEDMTELEDMAWTLCRELIDQQQNRREINAQNAKKSHESMKKNQNKQTKEPAKKFVPPTVEDVRSYCKAKGYVLDPARFVSYYESNGWRVGKNAMKSWQAAVQGWAARDKKEYDGMWTQETDTGNYEGLF